MREYIDSYGLSYEDLFVSKHVHQQAVDTPFYWSIHEHRQDLVKFFINNVYITNHVWMKVMLRIKLMLMSSTVPRQFKHMLARESNCFFAPLILRDLRWIMGRKMPVEDLEALWAVVNYVPPMNDGLNRCVATLGSLAQLQWWWTLMQKHHEEECRDIQNLNNVMQALVQRGLAHIQWFWDHNEPFLSGQATLCYDLRTLLNKAIMYCDLAVLQWLGNKDPRVTMEQCALNVLPVQAFIYAHGNAKILAAVQWRTRWAMRHVDKSPLRKDWLQSMFAQLFEGDTLKAIQWLHAHNDQAKTTLLTIISTDPDIVSKTQNHSLVAWLMEMNIITRTVEYLYPTMPLIKVVYRYYTLDLEHAAIHNTPVRTPWYFNKPDMWLDVLKYRAAGLSKCQFMVDTANYHQVPYEWSDESLENCCYDLIHFNNLKSLQWLMMIQPLRVSFSNEKWVWAAVYYSKSVMTQWLLTYNPQLKGSMLPERLEPPPNNVYGNVINPLSEAIREHKLDWISFLTVTFTLNESQQALLDQYLGA